MIIGYARVSTAEQNLARQIKQLQEAGCEVIYEEKVSGATTDRPELQRLLATLQAGDVIVVSDLTRISRSSRDLFELVDVIKDKGASLKSIKDTWLDTTSDNPYSEFLLTVMAGVAQLERNLIKQRQAEGVALAKESGKYKGRTKKYTDKHAGMNHAIELYKTGQYTVKQICEITKVSRSAFYRELNQRRLQRI
jgi:DNA invertase Pin-like site-specific DNA recombinase